MKKKNIKNSEDLEQYIREQLTIRLKKAIDDEEARIHKLLTEPRGTFNAELTFENLYEKHNPIK